MKLINQSKMIGRVLLLCFIFLLVDITGAKQKLNAIVSVKSVERCPDDPGTWDAHYYVRKYNRTTTILLGNMTMDDDLDDSLTLNFQMNRWSDGGWKKNFVTIQRNKACSSLMFVVPDIIRLLLTYAGHPVKCPIPKDVYRVNNFPAQIPVPNLIRNLGTFQTIVKVIQPKNSRTLLCLQLTTLHGD